LPGRQRPVRFVRMRVQVDHLFETFQCNAPVAPVGQPFRAAAGLRPGVPFLSRTPPGFARRESLQV
jgi:hypothetical protein